MPNWPRHPDGSRKCVGEMTRPEQRAVFKAACQRLEAEFANPLVQEKLTAILRGESVKH